MIVILVILLIVGSLLGYWLAHALREIDRLLDEVDIAHRFETKVETDLRTRLKQAEYKLQQYKSQQEDK